MNTLNKIASAGLCAIAVLASPLANASLTNNQDGTFTDSDSGYVWRTLAQYDGMTYAEAVSLLPTGFAAATAAQLAELVQHVSAHSTGFASDAAAMGAPVDYGQIWGFYGNGSAYAWIEDWNTNWSSTAYVASDWYNYGYSVPSDYSSAGLSLFAVNTSPISVSAVPEPGSLAMVVLGIAGIGTLRRKRPAA
jgi:hypothetical protein